MYREDRNGPSRSKSVNESSRPRTTSDADNTDCTSTNCGHIAGESGAASVNGNGAQPKRPAARATSMCEQRQHCKFGFHLAVPMGKRSPGNKSSSTSTPHVIALVGLPARGKTYISKKLSRYLNWIGINTRVFNLGDYRRRVEANYCDHSVFDPNNEKGSQMRDQICQKGLEDVLNYLENENGEVAVFDATNTTKKRRKTLYDKIVVEKGFKLFFVESICFDESIIDSNIREVKVTSPDYVSYEKTDDVVADFRKRIKHYEAQYETIDEAEESDYSFIKIFDAGKKVLVHKHEGHIQSRIVYYLMNVHITPRTIYLARHGESYNNVEGRLGGDSDLTPRGFEFAKKLGSFFNNLTDKSEFKVWTSWMKRAIDTAQFIDGVQERWKTLNEIDSGVCDDLTYEEIKERWPEDFVARDIDKYRYRYPRGESYEDLVARLEPVIMELERQESVLVVGHQAVNRCLLGYFLEKSEEDLPWIDIPFHTIVKLSPIAYGCKVEYIPLGIPSVSTHRPKPDVPGQLVKSFQRATRKIVEDMTGIEFLIHQDALAYNERQRLQALDIST